VLNGVRPTRRVKEETNRMLRTPGRVRRRRASRGVDAASAAKEWSATLRPGAVVHRPSPESGLAGAWKYDKSIQINPPPALGKTRRGDDRVAVSAQSLQVLTYFNRGGEANGATDRRSARRGLRTAGGRRMFSTVLIGNPVD